MCSSLSLARVIVLSAFSGTTGDMSPPPTNLVTSEVTPYSFRVSWTAPAESVDKYRVEYYPVAGGPPQEVRVRGPTLFIVLCLGILLSFITSHKHVHCSLLSHDLSV